MDYHSLPNIYHLPFFFPLPLSSKEYEKVEPNRILPSSSVFYKVCVGAGGRGAAEGSHLFPVGHFQYFQRRKLTDLPLTGGALLSFAKSFV